jgi:hypothetical protein
MHDIEIILQGDSTFVIQQSKQDLRYSADNSENRDSGLGIGSGLGREAANAKMNSKSQHSFQQAAAITKAPLTVAANKAKAGINKSLAKLNNGKFMCCCHQQCSSREFVLSCILGQRVWLFMKDLLC